MSRQPFKFETPKLFEQTRIDSLAIERLTASPYILKEYAYCGYTIVSEAGELSLNDVFTDPGVSCLRRLSWGYGVASALSDIHSTDSSPLRSGDSGAPRPTLAHMDLTIENGLLRTDDSVVVNDFNDGILPYFSESSGHMCRHRNERMFGLHYESRPPEQFTDEGYVSPDKVDVWALGIILVDLVLNCTRPFEELSYGELLEKQRILPVPRHLYESRETAILALLYAGLACLSPNAEDRPVAYQVAEGLGTAFKWIQQGKMTSTVQQVKTLFLDRDDLFADIRVVED